jgi:arginine-tRNA-protein transferase
VLSVLQEAVLRQLDYVYLGFFVKGCRSLEYKATYQPNELLDAATGEWKPFRDRNLRGSGEVAP